ncbi:MAG: polyhydroxyalkanoate synthesis regulator DNA-binding domain-containing protein [Kofleriaceae bacterium]
MAAVVIKKYGNRRLYDTEDSKYVTLDELAAKIRAGTDLRVVDAQSGADLTQATLTQVILETGNAAKFLPVQLLTQMIRLSDDALAEFFSRYVTGALDLYLQAKRGVQNLAAFNPLTQIPGAASDAFTRMWMGGPFGGGFPSPAPHGSSRTPTSHGPQEPEPEPEPELGEHTAPQRDDVASLRRELDELRQTIRDGLSSRTTRKKRKS